MEFNPNFTYITYLDSSIAVVTPYRLPLEVSYLADLLPPLRTVLFPSRALYRPPWNNGTVPNYSEFGPKECVAL
jgi:hypothetical protein